MQIFSYFLSASENLSQSLLQKFFFFGYKALPQKTLDERVSNLMSKGAKRIALNVEAYYLPARLQKEHVIVFAHTSSLWQLQSKNYDHFKDHADVVLWNPSKLTPKQYQQDLKRVIEKIRILLPDKIITVIARCATVEPTIAASADLQDRNINLVLDRGYGNVKKLARSQSFFSLLPCVQSILLNQFDCRGENRIKDIPGKILFTHPQYDQLLKWDQQDLTKDLINGRGICNGDRILALPGSDHWTPWNRKVHQSVYDFIGLKGVDVNAFSETSHPPTFVARYILPYLVKGWC